MYTVSSEQLKSYIQRVERLEEEKARVSDDIKDLFAEMKGHGYDTKTIRRILKMRRMDQEEFHEQEALFELYLNALAGKATNAEEENSLSPESE